MYKSIVERHEAQLVALEKVLSHAPHARDAGTAVERVLRICVVSRLVHIARILPPCFSVDLLKHCHEFTMNFVVQHLYAWKKDSFWDKTHEKLARWNVELPIAEGGSGIVPQWRLAEASFAASWLQPLSTMAQAKEVSEHEFLHFLQNSPGFPSIQLVKEALTKLGYSGGLINVFEAFQHAIEKETSRQAAKLPPELVGQEREEMIWLIFL